MFFQIYSDENWITIKCENKIRCQKTRKTFIKKIEKGSRKVSKMWLKPTQNFERKSLILQCLEKSVNRKSYFSNCHKTTYDSASDFFSLGNFKKLHIQN